MLCLKRLFYVSFTIMLLKTCYCPFSYKRKLRLKEVKLLLARLNNPNKNLFLQVFLLLHLTLQPYISNCLVSPSTPEFLITALCTYCSHFLEYLVLSIMCFAPTVSYSAVNNEFKCLFSILTVGIKPIVCGLRDIMHVMLCLWFH